MMGRTVFLILTLLIPVKSMAQEYVFIKPLVEMLEEGRSQDVKNVLGALTRENPTDPGILYLNAVFNADARAAVKIYEGIVTDHPTSFASRKASERLAQFFQITNQPEKAKIHIDRLVSGDDTPPVVADMTKINERLQQQQTFEVKVPPPSDGRVYIQIGAFTSKATAESTLKKATSKGLPGKIIQETTKGILYYKARVGPYISKTEAGKNIDKVKTVTGIRGFIVQE